MRIAILMLVLAGVGFGAGLALAGGEEGADLPAAAPNPGAVSEITASGARVPRTGRIGAVKALPTPARTATPNPRQTPVPTIVGSTPTPDNRPPVVTPKPPGPTPEPSIDF